MTEHIRLTSASSFETTVSVAKADIVKIDAAEKGSRIILNKKNEDGTPHTLLVKETPEEIKSL